MRSKGTSPARSPQRSASAGRSTSSPSRRHGRAVTATSPPDRSSSAHWPRIEVKPPRRSSRGRSARLRGRSGQRWSHFGHAHAWPRICLAVYRRPVRRGGGATGATRPRTAGSTIEARWRASPWTTSALPLRPLTSHECDIATGDVAPSSASYSTPIAVASLVNRLDECGPDPAHRVEDEVPGSLYAAIALAAMAGSIFAVRGRERQVTPGTLSAGGSLRGRPDSRVEGQWARWFSFSNPACRTAEVLVDDEVDGRTARAGMANRVSCPVRRSGDEVAVADSGIERDDVLAGSAKPFLDGDPSATVGARRGGEGARPRRSGVFFVAEASRPPDRRSSKRPGVDARQRGLVCGRLAHGRGSARRRVVERLRRARGGRP